MEVSLGSFPVQSPRFLLSGKAALALLVIWSRSSWACATCGLSASFTPLMLVISLGFVIFPFTFVGYIAWRLWKDQQYNQYKKGSGLP